MRAVLVRCHRYLSLACALFWCVQALTGTMLVFRFEIYDTLIPGAQTQANFDALDDRITRLEQQNPGWRRQSIWASGSNTNRFDLVLDAPDGEHNRYWRVDGHGRVLQVGPISTDSGGSHFFNTLTRLHYTLLLGDAGRWIIALSGILLISNIVLALKVAWPKRGQLKAVLFPVVRGPLRAQLWTWHRTIGLWLAIPAAMMVGFGVLEAFEDEIATGLGVKASPPPATPAAATAPIGLGAAVKLATPLFPKASVSGVGFPSADNPFYVVRLRQPGEPVKAFGRTKVYVSQAGHIIHVYDPLKVGAAEGVTKFFYPAHTGEAFGVLGRFAALLLGLWLLTMAGLGISMWAMRRPRTPAR